MFKSTVKELADKLGVDRSDASGFISVLVKKGLATKSADKQKSASGKGKASDVFELPETIAMELQSKPSSEG